MRVLFLVALLAQAGPSDTAQQPGTTLETRPPASRLSPLQERLDAAAPGALVEVAAGTYHGDLYIDRPLRLIGRGRPRLVGSGAGSVVIVRADDVLVEGFEVDGRAGGDLGRDSSGIHVAGRRAVIRDCRILNALFGVYLREADGSRVERTLVRGIREKTAGEKGSGIHVWNTSRFELVSNDIADVRDGIYIQSSPFGQVRGNVARDLRYGLHYMYSDDNVFEDNLFENGAAGASLMYSRRLTFRRNRFLRNRGFASVGLLLRTCDDVLAEHNLIADNARGVFLEGSARTMIRENVVAGSDAALVIYDSAVETRIWGNSFVGNLTPLELSGRRTDTNFDGNYWSGNDALDLDGDGRTDRPYRLSGLFDHLRSNLTAGDLMSRSLGATLVATAERALPVLDPVPVFDHAPLARPPRLDLPVASVENEAARTAPVGLALSCALMATSAFAVYARRRSSLLRRPSKAAT